MQHITQKRVFLWKEMRKRHPQYNDYTKNSREHRVAIAHFFICNAQQKQSKHSTSKNSRQCPPYIQNTLNTNHGNSGKHPNNAKNACPDKQHTQITFV